MTDGYFHDPAIYGSQIAFVSEDDLWLFDLETKSPASRLTSSKGQIRNPIFNKDGTKIAYSSNEFGSFELYTFDITSGEHSRLTYLGRLSIPRFWDSESNEIIFSTNYGRAVSGLHLYKVYADGGEPELLPFDQAISYYRRGEAIVIARFQDETARWKRYQGGTAGQIWYAADGTNFVKLEFERGNYVNPILLDEYIYFLSDFEGSSNLYRIKADGGSPEQLTFADDYYFRRAYSDGSVIIMQKGGELFVYYPASNEVEKVEIKYISSREVRKPKFVDAAKFTEHIAINRDDTHAMVISRGKTFYFPFWEEGTMQVGKEQGVRYKHPIFHPKEDFVYLISDELGEDQIEIYDMSDLNREPEVISANIGIPFHIHISPRGDHLALYDNRQELILVSLQDKKSKVIYSPTYENITDIDWSPDGKWIVFAGKEHENSTQIAIYGLEQDKIQYITTGNFLDYAPKFSTDGKYLYFLSNRAYHPLMDSHLFQYDFPKPTKLLGVSLTKDDDSPIAQRPRPLSENGKKSKNSNNKENEDNNEDKEKPEFPEVTIDFDGISDRIVEMPVPNDRIHDIRVAADRILFRTSPVQGMQPNLFGPPQPSNNLNALLLKDQKVELVMDKITDFDLSDSKSTIVVKQGDKYRLLPINHLKKMEKNGAQSNGNTRETKYLDLSRIKLRVDPHQEWEQMLKETWKLMKDHYWEENMAGINWELMLERYLRLVKKISSRAELSDLFWELQGETRTSHSYEIGGDYDFPPNYAPSYLGVDIKYNEAEGGYQITKVYSGDVWDTEQGSPAKRVGLVEGDVILAVDGVAVSQTKTVQELLMGKRNQEVYFKVKSHDNGEINTMAIKPVPSNSPMLYRDWVEENRRYVHEKTNRKVGYMHLPNMHYNGLQEFYRYFKLETAKKDALIIDVRHNGGGHTSELFLEKLAKQRLGFGIPRYGTPTPYPSYSVPGPMVAITNQNAGSDGDIFSHGFKMMNLGSLIGTRTWGGVVGIWPKVRLVDGTTVTQPEYSFWFSDVGYQVENYGTDPDIEVDLTPNDAMAGIDPQLDKAIEVILAEMRENPVDHPDFSDKPIKT